MKAEKKKFQSIRNRVIKRLAIAFMGMVFLLYLVLNSIMLDKIDLLEHRFTEQNVNRVVNAIQHDQRTLEAVLTDWALWDDTYEYMETRDEKYVKANLGYSTFSNLNLDVMAFVDAKGEYIYGGETDQENKESKEIQKLSPVFVDYIAKSHVLENDDPEFRLAGIIMLDDRPMMIAVSPVLKTDAEGPLRGHVIIGSYIDAEKIKQIGEQTDQNLSIDPFTSLTAEQAAAFAGISGDKDAIVKVQGPDAIAGYTMLRDIHGENVLGVTVRMDRSVYNVGNNAIKATLLVLAGLFFVFQLALLSFLDGSVLLRLEHLSGQIRRIGKEKVFSRRIEHAAEQSDELTTVIDEINAMLQALETAQQKLRDNETELKQANEELQLEIRERKRAQDDIKYIAYHDYLTGLPNRILCTKLLNKAIETSRQSGTLLAVMFLDIDGFKMVNDTMGHVVGDHLLQEVAQRLKTALRPEDVVVRFGGDEFIVLLENIRDPMVIGFVADKIVKCFRKPFVLNERDNFVTTSIGIAIYPSDGETADSLIKNADIAMYKAKDRGKNQHAFCTPVMRSDVSKMQELSNMLHRAIERNELELYYQPQVSCTSQEIIGMEALIRWKHPGMGLISPGDFIPLAERTGLIAPIGKWVLRTACEQNKRWQEAGFPRIRMGVNISLQQFKLTDLIRAVDEVLQETQLDPEDLEVEITESIVVSEKELIIHTLTAFRERGIHIAIDDFGTKYSSLTYIRHFPADKIKIDMSFVRGIGINAKDEAIIKAILVLARSLGIEVIAEGVETEQQWEFLKQEQCDEIQGYYFYRPMPAQQVTELLQGISEEKKKLAPAEPQ